jgi:hypothetical protein
MLFGSCRRTGNNKAVHVNLRNGAFRTRNRCLPSSARSVKNKLGCDLLTFIAPMGKEEKDTEKQIFIEYKI